MNVLKSIGAVLAGMLVGAILSLVVDVICHATGMIPTAWAGYKLAVRNK